MKTFMKKWKWKILILVYLCFIYGNSLTPAAISSKESGYFLAKIQDFLAGAGMDAWRKQAHYARVQELAHRFQSAHGSYLCRDLLAGVETTPGGAPEARTAQYYAKRPCAGLCESAAALFDAYVQENPPEKQP